MATNSARLLVHALPAFEDNYLWLIQSGKHAIVVDPGDADVVARFLHQAQLSLQAILLTHHHADHTAGAAALQQYWQCPVYAPVSTHSAYDAMQTLRVAQDQHIALPGLTGVPCKVLALPGHTLDHVAYLLAEQHLFSGDVLFGAGCGRLFEGSPAQMYASLQRIAQLPADTLIYPAHEYTANNIVFALQVEPDNPALQARAMHTRDLRAAGRPTLPTTLALELDTNPFLRCPQIMQKQPQLGTDALAVFTELRQQRNHFNGVF